MLKTLSPQKTRTLLKKTSQSLKRSTHSYSKKNATGLKTLRKYGTPITDSASKADLLNEHFHTVFSKQIPTKLSALCSHLSNHFSRQETDMPDISITENGVLKLLNKLDTSKAAGPDGIRPRIMKEQSSELASILTLLFKASLHQQCLPDIWKQANVTPIYKKGDKTRPANYRPVSDMYLL